MNKIQKKIDTLSKYFRRQFLFEGEVWTIQDCIISVNSEMEIIACHFIAYSYRDRTRTYQFNFDIETVMKRLIEVH